jgi:hypothetical protein
MALTPYWLWLWARAPHEFWLVMKRGALLSVCKIFRLLSGLVAHIHSVYAYYGFFTHPPQFGSGSSSLWVPLVMNGGSALVQGVSSGCHRFSLCIWLSQLAALLFMALACLHHRFALFSGSSSFVSSCLLRRNPGSLSEKIDEQSAEFFCQRSMAIKNKARCLQMMHCSDAGLRKERNLASMEIGH